MLHDRARIYVAGGAGGDGCVSFRREAHVPKGGPDGGDGGHGGEVVLVCDDALRDLAAFRHRRRYVAGRGGHGQGSQRHGADGETLEVRVPPGTLATADDGARWDLTRPGQRAVVARGGAGGRGNRSFRGPTRQAPRLAERGLAGEERTLDLQLKLLADVGLVGLPNAGKSSLLRRMTRASPKVADYPFTTLVPVLGTLQRDERQLVIADIPGLIEGASEGAGLGHEFLAHVERTRVLVHVLDIAPVDGSDPVESFRTVESELGEHDPRLAALPRVLALSKVDLVDEATRDRAVAEWRDRTGLTVVATSSATGEGLDRLAGELLRLVPERGPEDGDDLALADAPAAEDLAEYRVFRPGAGRGWEVERADDGTFVVTGERTDRLIARFDVSNEDALAHIERRLRRMGVIDALAEHGFEPGDDVEIGGIVFELDPELPPGA